MFFFTYFFVENEYLCLQYHLSKILLMKTFKLLSAFIALLLTATGCVQKKEAPKALVLYYSQTSNTKTVAQEMATKLGADQEEIELVNPYDGDFNATIARCMQEREAGTLPELKPLKSDLSKYDIIFLGYPIWFGTYAPPIAALLEQIDLSGKKVVPFCTFGSGGLESSAKDLAAKEPKAEVLPGYGVRTARVSAAPQEIDYFLKSGGWIEGTVTPLADFSEAHAVSEDESAIFDAAVGDYAMLHAKAKTVAVRSIPGGMEYLFGAEDLPREGMEPTTPPAELLVYVTVLDGAAPEFTKVVR